MREDQLTVWAGKRRYSFLDCPRCVFDRGYTRQSLEYLHSARVSIDLAACPIGRDHVPLFMSMNKQSLCAGIQLHTKHEKSSFHMDYRRPAGYSDGEGEIPSPWITQHNFFPDMALNATLCADAAGIASRPMGKCYVSTYIACDRGRCSGMRNSMLAGPLVVILSRAFYRIHALHLCTHVGDFLHFVLE